jgi:multiple sugar transport system substrate-binding protein
MFSNGIKLCFVIIVILSLLLSIATISISFSGISAAAQKRQVTLTTVLDDQGDPPRALKMFYQPALQDLRARHPDLDIKLDYRPIPYLNLRTQLLKTMANQTPVDIMTVDQLWLGEFVQKGFLTDITNRTYSWGRESEWYPANWASGIYNHKVYGISPYTDVRGMWYWKDLLNKSGVDPNSLKTWDGYIAAAKKLNAVLRHPSPIHLSCTPFPRKDIRICMH